MNTTNTHTAPDKQSVEKIVTDIYALKSPALDENDKTRRQQISELIATTINGDKYTSHLPVSANLENGKMAILLYILTNHRVIKVDIDAQTTQSKSFFLDKIIGVDRKLLDGGRAEVAVSFENGSFGLKYPSTNNTIVAFFQELDAARAGSP